MNSSLSKPPVERYLDHLDKIFQQEPTFVRHDSEIENLPGLTAIIYRNVPDVGFITGITYDLSLVNHPAWKFGRPELCISVKSENALWVAGMTHAANRLRGKCPFSYGETINFREQISPDSEMDAFFVFAPSILERNDYTNIDIGTGYNINIVGLYPMYSDELETYHKMGLKDFWHHPNFDLYDVNRKRITL